MNPCLPASGVKYPRGWTIKCFLIPAASRASFIKRHASIHWSGPKWQLIPTISAPKKRSKCDLVDQRDIMSWTLATVSESVLSIELVSMSILLGDSQYERRTQATPGSWVSWEERHNFWIRRFLHKSDTAISYIRSDSVGIVQQDTPKKLGETPCKGWTDCKWAAMGHKRWRCLNANWMG